MDQSSEAKWLKLTNHGEWATHTVSVTLAATEESISGGRLLANNCDVLERKRWTDTIREPVNPHWHRSL